MIQREGFDASKILKTFEKSFKDLFISKKSLEQSSRDFTVGMTGFEPATPSTPC